MNDPWFTYVISVIIPSVFDWRIVSHCCVVVKWIWALTFVQVTANPSSRIGTPITGCSHFSKAVKEYFRHS